MNAATIGGDDDAAWNPTKVAQWKIKKNIFTCEEGTAPHPKILVHLAGRKGEIFYLQIWTKQPMSTIKGHQLDNYYWALPSNKIIGGTCRRPPNFTSPNYGCAMDWIVKVGQLTFLPTNSAKHDNLHAL